MPVIKSAKKKLRKDKKRTLQNYKTRDLLKNVIKQAKKQPSEKNLKVASVALDKAAKNHLIHKNKASRLKSSLAKQVNKSTASSTKKKTKKAPVSKSSK